jgi:hypothetical protein
MIQRLRNPETETLLCDLQVDDFVNNFNRRPFKIRHQLCEHALFDLQRLIELSRTLPADRVEYNAGDLPISQDPNRTPQNGLSVEETIERIANCKSWLVLKNIELDVDYKSLLERCLREIEGFSSLVSPGMTQQQGFIFISSPGSITPFHIDPENNFLLQIRGTKTVWMFGQDDRVVLNEQQIEEFFHGAHRNLAFNESYRERGQKFQLLEGEGLHFPVVAPHFVENGPEVSVSFSLTFQTADSADRQTLHRFNRKLRRFGINPSGVGRSPWRDQLKLSFLKSLRFARNVIQR